MLNASDIIAGKIIVQLGLSTEADVREQLRALDADPSARWDLVNGLNHAGKLKPEGIELVRHRMALYEQHCLRFTRDEQIETYVEFSSDAQKATVHQVAGGDAEFRGQQRAVGRRFQPVKEQQHDAAMAW